jgi:hypothetical protein
MKVAIFMVLTFLTAVASGQTTDNARLTQFFNADQSSRHGKDIDWKKVAAEDEIRRQEVHHLLESGEVRTASDYFHAALVYQHGQRPEDFLLAHVLAVNAISLGDRNARWLVAATLDRYLLANSQSQIYGTQFESIPGKNDSWMHRTMNGTLITDSMRSVLCVFPLEGQQKILDEVKSSGNFRSTSIPNCQ